MKEDIIKNLEKDVDD